MSMSLSRLLADKKQRTSTKEQIQSPIFKSHISPVELPEVLGQIFSYLTRREIRLSVLRVCKLWNSLAHDIIPRVNTWNETYASSKLSLVEYFLNLGTDVLRCVGPKGPTKPAKLGSTLRRDSWLMLGSILETLPKWKLMRIKTVTMSGEIDPDISLYPFIPIFCGLKTLRLERLTTDVVLLDTILRLCPNITDLFVSSEEPYGETTRKLEFEFEKIPLPALRLRSLTLWRWAIKMSTLQVLLKQCQYVQELKLIRLHFLPIPKVVSIEDYACLLHDVAASCPRVRSLHFSVGNQFLDRPLFMEIMYAFPNLEAWGVEKQDANSWMYDYLQTHMLQTLTTLEIVHASHHQYSFHAEKGLHNFLCEAPNLLHLRAEGILISAKDIFVLADPLPSRKSIGDSIELRTVGSEDEPAKRIWACRNLRTLRIGFQGGSHAFTYTAVKSRALFAYIANVCPRLSELHLNHNYLSFSVKGGFCLLSGLDRLKYLSACSDKSTENGVFPTKDFEWFRSDGKRVPWAQMTGMQKIVWRKYLVTLKGGVSSVNEDRRYKPPRSLAARWSLNRATLSPDDQLIYDIQKASSLDNVAKVLDRLRRSDAPCWPLLETLHVKSTCWEETVRELRPGLEREVSDE
ncbi:hypothetical protein BGX26_006698 [Mortierella sp. AD094]|nr:hypothetical protein BGX26_006698 [Mortierella sp. AD094]